MFKMNDKVVPKAPHGWYDICCQVIRVRNETMCLVDNGQGGKMWLHESQLDYLCAAVNGYIFQVFLNKSNNQKPTKEDK